jgi:hypothetical protein
VKRVAAVEEGQVRLRGDAARSTDSRRFGAMPLEEIRSRAAFRYWPPTRAGFIATTDTITDAAPD